MPSRSHSEDDTSHVHHGWDLSFSDRENPPLISTLLQRIFISPEINADILPVFQKRMMHECLSPPPKKMIPFQHASLRGLIGTSQRLVKKLIARDLPLLILHPKMTTFLSMKKIQAHTQTFEDRGGIEGGGLHTKQPTRNP